MIDWLFTNALAALALAAIAGTLIWTFRPSPAVRHALWLVVLLKLVSPTGLVVSVPLPVETPVPIERDIVAGTTRAIDDPVVVEEEVFTLMVAPEDGQTAEEAATLALRADDEPAPTSNIQTDPMMQSVAPPGGMSGEPIDYRPYLLGLWLVGAMAISWRQLRETIRFARFTARARPAPDALVAEVAVVANRLGVRVPRVGVLTGLASPVMWCLWRPVLLWPAGLECRLKGGGRRAVLAHELAHLRRRDHWVRRLEMVASVFHWWNPLFWLARQKMRADAELACDAWAAGQADPRAYAEALLEVCSFNPRRRPAPAVGVFGEGRRAMQERLTMIMRDRVPCRLAFGAKLVVALMVIAAVPAWTLGQGKPAPAGKPEKDPQVLELEANIKALSEKLDALRAAKKLEATKKLEAARIKIADAHKKPIKGSAAEGHYLLKIVGPESAVKTTRTITVVGSGDGKFKVVDGDGTEAKDVQVVVVEGKSGAAAMVKDQPKPADGQSRAPMFLTVVGSGDGKYKVVDGDGKEAKDVQILVVDPNSAATPAVKPGTAGVKVPKMVEVPAGSSKFYLQTGGVKKPTGSADAPGTFAWTVKPGDAQSVTLSRATYKLPKEQAAALATLLGSIKATVMESKVDGENITVTTTPEAQAAIGQIVRLITGQGSGTFRWDYKVTPPTPATPVKPTPGAIKKPATGTLQLVPSATDLKADVLRNVELELKNLNNLRIGELNIEKLKDLEKLKELDKLKELQIDKASLEKLKDVEKLKSQLDKVRIERLRDVEKLKADVEKTKGAESQKARELEAAIKALLEASQTKPVKPSPDKPAK